MMNYKTVTAFKSQFNGDKLFLSEREAVEADRAKAMDLMGITSLPEYESTVFKALRFIVDYIEQQPVVYEGRAEQ